MFLLEGFFGTMKSANTGKENDQQAANTMEIFFLLSTDAIAVTKWDDKDEAFLNIAKGIRAAVTKLNSQ